MNEPRSIPMTDENLFNWYALRSMAEAKAYWARLHPQPVAKTKGKK